ncbi:hypothetical protein TrCOL_g631 [Triparma columacea]|uniref:Uncharacterized protein n=1 Tax=Triparma columacea TaxID=722753 RepID=A0A9W7LED8_9STRA|nr:hypothetical protein TrCOL_g631 [Triparma columacea]
MDPSLPPPPSQPPSRASVVDEEEDKKRRSIYGELRTYLDGLKASSSSRPSSSSEQPQVNDSGDDNEGPSIDFPENFDDVVSLMSRADLEFGEDGDRPEVEIGADTPFSNGPPTESSVDWSKVALAEGLGKLGVYYKYEQELKRDQSDREKIEKALAKVQLLDRKIGVKEMEHGARIGEYKKEVEGLEKEIEMFEQEYVNAHGVAPPGSRLKSSPQKPSKPNPHLIDEAYQNGPPSSRSSTSSNRFFLTDKLRKNTPRSARKVSRSAMASPAGSDISDVQGLKAMRSVAPQADADGVGDEDYEEYKKAKSGKNKLPPSGTAAVGAIERNKKMAGRAGQSSLTLEEEARVKLLLGPDTEGDDPAGEMFAPNGGADDSVEHETKGDLFTNVFGGLGEKSRLSEVDEKLRELGVNPEEEFEEAQTPREGGGKVKGEGVLRARARERAEKGKEKMLDDALKEVKGKEMEVVGQGGVGEEDIKHMAKEAMSDLLHEGCEVAPKEEITAVLDKLQHHLRKQAAAREDATRERRKEIEDVIKFDRERSEEVGEAGGTMGLDFKDLAYEPKKWSEEIGEVYQSGWEGNDEVWEEDYEEEKGGEGGGEEKEEEEKRGEEGKERKKIYEDDEEEEEEEEDKENDAAASSSSVAKSVNLMENMKMELFGAQSKAMLSLDRADKALKAALLG